MNYITGETIFNNLFLTDTSTEKPSSISDRVYVELYDPKGNRIMQQTLYVKEGTGEGKNKVSIKFSDADNLIPYAFVLNGSSLTPSSSKNCPLQLNLNLANSKVKQNELAPQAILHSRRTTLASRVANYH